MTIFVGPGNEPSTLVLSGMISNAPNEWVFAGLIKRACQLFGVDPETVAVKTIYQDDLEKAIKMVHKQ